MQCQGGGVLFGGRYFQCYFVVGFDYDDFCISEMCGELVDEGCLFCYGGLVCFSQVKGLVGDGLCMLDFFLQLQDFVYQCFGGWWVVWDIDVYWYYVIIVVYDRIGVVVIVIVVGVVIY